MKQKIVIAYNYERPAFEQLINAYPLGKYSKQHQSTQWFTVEIDIFDVDQNNIGLLELVWFVEWRI